MPAAHRAFAPDRPANHAARYYRPTIDRFLSEDPIEFAAGPPPDLLERRGRLKMDIQSTERQTTDRRRPHQLDRRAQRRDNARDRRAAVAAHPSNRPGTHEEAGAVLHDAAALGFSKRRPGAGITWTTLTAGRMLLERSVGEAVNVTLHHMFETVRVRNIRPGPAGGWIGTIQGFERSRGPYRGIQIGEDIRFKEENVFSAGD